MIAAIALVGALGIAVSSPATQPAPATAPDDVGARVCVIVHATGLADDERARLAEAARADVVDAGGSAVTPSRLLDVPAGCLEDAACIADVLRATSAELVVWLVAFRAGGHTQVRVRVVDAHGGVSVDETQASTRALPPAVRGAIHVRERASDTATAQHEEAEDAAGATSTRTPDARVVEPIEPRLVDARPIDAPPAAPAPLFLAGVASGAVGALTLVAAGVGAVWSSAALTDATSTGAQKADASVVVPSMIALGVGGGALIVVGGICMLVASDG